jgi:TolB protein
MRARVALIGIVLVSLAAVLLQAAPPPQAQEKPLLTPEEQKHLRNVRQVTFGGQNAEAYFSADDQWLSFQHAGEGVPCDQQYVMPVDPTKAYAIYPPNPNEAEGLAPQARRVSNGEGRTTCGYVFPDDQRVLFSSTHGGSAACPKPADYSQGYVWAIYPSYKIYTAKMDGSDVKLLENAKGYNAEATITRDGKKIVFTSTRDGDLDIYSMNADGSGAKRLTNELGYDGGPFWSADGKKIVYRAYHPKTPQEIKEYKDLLAKDLIKPANFELWVMDADGTHKRQITHNGAANFAPFWHPDGKRIVFASNVADAKNPRNFDLYLINADGTGLERLTFDPDFDAFPMFTSDGKKLVWASNRNGTQPHETNVFIADFVE